MSKTFLLIDDTMTMHGIRFALENGRWERFLKNPTMLYMHVRGKVIGKWENVRFEAGAWLADSDFDIEDPEVQPIAKKVERGYLNACSPGVMIHAAEFIDGELVATDWEPYEGSIVDVGSNLNALQLYSLDGEMIKDTESYIKNLTLSVMEKKVKTGEELVKEIVEKEVFPKGIVLALGLPEESANDIVAKAVTDLLSENVSLKLAVKNNEQTRGVNLVEAAFNAQKISDSDKTHYLKLAAVDYDTTKAILDGIEAPKNLTEFAAKGSDKTPEEVLKADKAEYDAMFKEGKLFALKEENPTKFKKLFKAYHGTEPSEA